MNEVFIRDEFIRLDAALKFSGVIGTGGQAKMVIQDGLVLVNDEVCTMRGKKLRSGDVVKFEDVTFVIKNEG
ncbi:MAG: RNA-binding S4 domain-containing protein [Clostridia bacterium]|nr:RNA-binding S4 domain-containing protein [Clostridia bacterium]